MCSSWLLSGSLNVSPVYVHRHTVIVTLVMLGLLASYYIGYARFNLKLSPEELISIDAEVRAVLLMHWTFASSVLSDCHSHVRRQEADFITALAAPLNSCCLMSRAAVQGYQC